MILTQVNDPSLEQTPSSHTFFDTLLIRQFYTLLPKYTHPHNTLLLGKLHPPHKTVLHTPPKVHTPSEHTPHKTVLHTPPKVHTYPQHTPHKTVLQTPLKVHTPSQHPPHKTVLHTPP